MLHRLHVNDANKIVALDFGETVAQVVGLPISTDLTEWDTNWVQPVRPRHFDACNVAIVDTDWNPGNDPADDVLYQTGVDGAQFFSIPVPAAADYRVTVYTTELTGGNRTICYDVQAGGGWSTAINNWVISDDGGDYTVYKSSFTVTVTTIQILLQPSCGNPFTAAILVEQLQ